MKHEQLPRGTVRAHPLNLRRLDLEFTFHFLTVWAASTRDTAGAWLWRSAQPPRPAPPLCEAPPLGGGAPPPPRPAEPRRAPYSDGWIDRIDGRKKIIFQKQVFRPIENRRSTHLRVRGVVGGGGGARPRRRRLVGGALLEGAAASAAPEGNGAAASSASAASDRRTA